MSTTSSGNATARRRKEPTAIRGSSVTAPTWRVEVAWAVGIWALAFATRAAVQWRLPTIPVSDFRTLLAFATCFSQGQCFSGAWYWDFVNPGLPLLLAPWLSWLPASPEAIARWVSVLLSSSLGLLPLLIWRGTVPNWTRRLAGALLALWPGSILTAGLLSQDNWVLFPSVALAALAVRNLAPRRARRDPRPLPAAPDSGPQIVQTVVTGPHQAAGTGVSSHPSATEVVVPPPAAGMPLLAVALWGLAVAIRQEMVLVLLPLVVPAGFGWPVRTWRWRRVLTAALAAAALLYGLASLRQHATGRFALTTRHGGLSLLGACMPGVGANYWASAWPYLAAVEPEALASDARANEAGFRLALAELRRRPLFHAARIAGSTLVSLASSDAQNSYWTLGNRDAIAPAAREAAGRLFVLAHPILLAENLIFHALFLVALALAAQTRNRATFWLAGAILLKVAVHAVIVTQGRYFVQVTALELLAIALTARAAIELRPRRRLLAPMVAGLMAMAALTVTGSWAHAAFLAHIEDPPRSYTFTIFSEHREASLSCHMDLGRLANLGPDVATIQPFPRDPQPGDQALAVCRPQRHRWNGSLAIRILDSYPNGDLPGRIVQRVRSGGRTLWEHDLAAEPGTGWHEIPIAAATDIDPPEVAIEVVAVRPDPGCGWGPAAATSFRISASSSVLPADHR